MVEIAREKFPHLQFEVGDVESLHIEEKFDYVLMDGTIGNVDDIQLAFKELRKICKPETRLIIVYYNYLWEPALKLAESLGLRMKHLLQHWLSLDDIANLLYLNDFEVVKKGYHCLMPVNIPLISTFLNRIMRNMPLFWKLSLNEVIVARPMEKRKSPEEVSCSVIVPCRNERGNIEQAVLRTPDMGKHTEIIYVEGNSQDGTLEECNRVRDKYPEKEITVLVQDGKGKGDAVRKGFAHAKNDVFMILDADLTVPPEDLPKFFEAIASGKGEFINGSRLVYQMEKEAMRFLNLLGNKFFSKAFTYLLEQRIRDTLCGTKVLWKEDYDKIQSGRDYFGNFDPFGDFDLLFGASKLNLKIVEIPIRYRERTYGRTQISRFRHGILLIKMTIFAMKKIKFI
jgi:SAM-dependent methyltransferase